MPSLPKPLISRALRGLVPLTIWAISIPVSTAFAQEAEPGTELAPESVVDPAFLEKLSNEAEELANDGEHLEAALRYYDVVTSGEEDDPTVKIAQYGLAVALFELELYQSATGWFERIVEAAESHGKYRKTLPYLLKIARRAAGDASVLTSLASYPSSLYPPDYTDEIHFLVGQHHYGQGSLDEALLRFQQVQESAGSFYVRAQYMVGVIHVQQSDLDRSPEEADGERLKEAATAFKTVLRHQRDKGSDETIDNVAEMAHLALGRLFFSTRQYDVAVRYYDQTESNSSDWLQALFEVSWVHFQLKQYPKALGNLHTLNSPYFEDQYFPESRVLQALILFYGCRYDEANTVVQDFVQEYYPLMTELKEQINQFADPNAFYTWLARLSKSESSEFSTRFKRIFNAALADTKLRGKFYFVTALNNEIQRIKDLTEDASDATFLLEDLQNDLLGYRSLIIGEAGSLAQARLMRVLKQLKHHLAAGLRIKGETLKAKRDQLAPSIEAEQAAAAAARMNIIVDDEHIEWPFTGEYWKDELGFYLYDVPSRCQKDTSN